MPVSLGYIANEQSSCRFRLVFKDESGAETAPTEVFITVVTANNEPIRDRAAAMPTGAQMDIVLSGSDLRILAGEDGQRLVERRLIVEWTYTSDAGANLPGKEEAAFLVENLTAIT